MQNPDLPTNNDNHDASGISGDEDDGDDNPLATPAGGWRPAFNEGAVRWETPRGTRCWKERRRAYRVRPGDHVVLAEEQHVTFVLGDAVFVQHSIIDRVNSAESITFQLLDAKEERLFLETRERSAPRPPSLRDGDDNNEADDDDDTDGSIACRFTKGDALSAGVVLRVFAQLERVDPAALLDQLPGEYGYKALLRRCIASSAASVADVRGPMMAALATRHGGDGRSDAGTVDPRPRRVKSAEEPTPLRCSPRFG